MHLKKQMLFAAILVASFAAAQNNYPATVETVLRKAGKNRAELEKTVAWCKAQKDTLKLRAAYFLIANMDIHYSANYYWADKNGKRLDYNESNYTDFASALAAFETIKNRYFGIHPVSYSYNDIDSIKADYLIDNIERAFKAWKNPWARDIPFDYFCEYILPYRVSVEPLQNWRGHYAERFQWIGDSLQGKTTSDALPCFAADFKKWFSNTYGSEKRKEPLPRLGALQLLSRKKGACEDISALVAFMLRSQGFPVSMDEVSYWATSTGRHYFNTVFDTAMSPIPLYDISTAVFSNHKFEREPAKVIRVTYAKQPGVLASFENKDHIPPGFMRTLNYIDVTSKYWETGDLGCRLFSKNMKPSVAYACVFNGMKWHPTWWGKVNADSVVFTSVCKGAVFVPAYYRQGKPEYAGYPVAYGYSHTLVLQPDTLHNRRITINQQDKYLIFRPGASYKLYYWNNGWQALGTQKAPPGATSLVFDQVPNNCLLLLIPDYSKGKERPFIITEDGTRLWF